MHLCLRFHRPGELFPALQHAVPVEPREDGSLQMPGEGARHGRIKRERRQQLAAVTKFRHTDDIGRTVSSMLKAPPPTSVHAG